MQPSTEPVCVVIKRGEAYPGKQDLDYFTGVSAETAGSKRLCMHLVAIPPRGRAKPHLHAHHESVTYMLSGEAGQRVRPTSGQALDHRYPLASCWLAWQWCLLTISSVWATSPPDQPASERGLAQPRRRVRRSAPRYWHCTGWLLRACLQRPRVRPTQHSSIVIGGDFMGMTDLLARQSAPRLRWCVCGLLFFATTINVDRQVLGLHKPVLEKELGWREADYGCIVSAFQLAYALMMPFAGRLIDWAGTRLGYAAAVALWSVAAMGHALARSAAGFGVARFALGLSESANFPAAIRTVADWFPQRERARAIGIFNSGANIGAILAPLAVPYLALHYGWRSAFIVTGAAGLAWVLLWWWFLRGPRGQPLLPSVEEELARPPLGSLLTSRPAWAFILGKFLTDPAWVFYLFWLPGFLNRVYGLDLAHLGLPIIVVYQASAVGSIGGGWISTALLKRGWTPNRAREAAMLICAVAVTPVIFVDTARANMWLVVALVGVATAAHQGWSANLYTLASDLFPRGAVGSVVGLGGLGGAVGGMLVAPLVGYWLDWSHGAYGPLFVIAGSVYLVAFAVIHWLVGRD